jgi:phytanoyl-CoA hydroxylase
LYTDPVKLVSFWIALDDATKENGCLWIAPGSHKSGVHRRYLRNKDPVAQELLVYDKPVAYYQQSSFRQVPVRRGTCILLHGQVVHYSDANKSETSRHAYTFNVIETQHVNYSRDNWIQPPKSGFPLLYSN